MKRLVSLVLSLSIILSLAVFSFAEQSLSPEDFSIDDVEFYEEDMYKVGVDLDPGEYYLLPLEADEDMYFEVTSDSNGKDILENSCQCGPQYITLEKGQYFNITRGRFALASLFPADPVEEIPGDGMYLVGKDIVAGEYKLTRNSDYSGYYEIFDNSTADRKIISNSIFEKSSYVTVSDGEYLNVSGCSGKLVG